MTAAVVAEAASGRTRCTTLRSDPPISLRETPEGLYLVASGAGPLGGDDLRLDVDVRRGASLVVRSAAASMVLPGSSGRPSSSRVRARVRGSLVWAPEPTILVAGCDHRATTVIDLDPGATVVWRDIVVRGRHHQSTGSLLQRVQIDCAGAPLLRTELPVGPRWPGADGPAGSGGARVIGSLVVAGGCKPTLHPTDEDVRAAVVALADGAWLITAIGGDVRAVGRCLDTAWCGDAVSGCRGSGASRRTT